MRSWIWILLLSGFAILSKAQSFQVVKGRLIDAQSESPLIGATIEWLTADQPTGTVTDDEGYFRLENVTYGRHSFRFSYLGYLPVTVPNVVVTSGKEIILELKMEEDIANLQEVVVLGTVQKDQPQNEMATVSARQFSLEEVQRFSGGRSDVARLAGNYAGVATANDARNDIVIRGNSPSGVLWRMEGIPIPNPNHFSTLSSTGGPVSALNPNVLRNSDFLTSAFPAEYGNVYGGVFDLNLRSGNADKHEYMVQLGAISGLETMVEGPMRNPQSSFLVAGRYSFVGLANKIGLNIGTNANPNYSDLAFKLDFAPTKWGHFSWFGLGGVSDIAFLRDQVDANDLFAPEDEDSYADSRLALSGIKHQLLLDDKSYLRSVIAFSSTRNTFSADRYLQADTPEEEKQNYFDINNQEYTLSWSSIYNRKISSAWSLRVGILLEQQHFDYKFKDRENEPDHNGDGAPDWRYIMDVNGATLTSQLFSQVQWRFHPQFTLQTGLHAQHHQINQQVVFEPRLGLTWAVTPKQRINLGFGVHHQSQPMAMSYLRQPTGPNTYVESNLDLRLTQANHLVLGHDLSLGPDWRSKVEVYYQWLTKVPVSPTTGPFSMLNLGADFGFPVDKHQLTNTGIGKNYGLEWTLEKFFSQGYYSLVTASWYRSLYQGSDEIERSTAFDGRYVMNLLTGKEWKFGPQKTKALTLDTKFTYAGGRPYTPVDLEASRAADQEVRADQLAYSERYPDYLRWDVKVGVQFNSTRRKVSHQFYFDIQNVTNRQNIFLSRYNRQNGEVNDVYQIGLFPDFMYRIQF